MGRRKVEIKRIESKSSRQVTFCKRRNGLMEKARQLSILCESSVGVVIVSNTGKLYSSSSGDSMANILKRYETEHADEPKTLLRNIVERDRHRVTSFFKAGDALEGLRQGSKLVDLAEKTRDYLSYKDLLDIVQSKLEDAESENVSVESLVSLEDQLMTALSVTRARKAELMMELVKSLQEKEKLLTEENQVLTSQLTQMEKNRFLETEDERLMSLEYNSGNTPPETLPLLK